MFDAIDRLQQAAKISPEAEAAMVDELGREAEASAARYLFNRATEGKGVIEQVVHQIRDVETNELLGAVVVSNYTNHQHEVQCTRCEGCGQVANSEREEPWTAWAELPPGSDLAVRAGIVKPKPCPECKGSGTRKSDSEWPGEAEALPAQ